MNNGQIQYELMTVQEVATLLRIGRSSAYELCRQPDFPLLRMGRIIRVPRSGLEQWITQQRNPDMAG
jgi:excisionase family DNA binding protein